MSVQQLHDRVRTLAREVLRDPKALGTMSTGERCAVALLHDLHQFLPEGFTFIRAVDSLGGDWLAAVRAVSREDWR